MKLKILSVTRWPESENRNGQIEFWATDPHGDLWLCRNDATNMIYGNITQGMAGDPKWVKVPLPQDPEAPPRKP